MEDTPSPKLANEYVRLGGSRKSKLDDNITRIRLCENDPHEAEELWTSKIPSGPEPKSQVIDGITTTCRGPFSPSASMIIRLDVVRGTRPLHGLAVWRLSISTGHPRQAA
jgi:hypothetical protein